MTNEHDGISILSEKSAAGVSARSKVMDGIVRKVGDTLANLYGRWLDEREHENFADYAKVMADMCQTFDCKFIKASKRPFGFTIQPNGFPYAVLVSVNTNSIGWKAVKS